MRNLILATLMLCAAQSAAQQPATHIDAARHEVSFDVGPFDVSAMNVHAMHGMSHENGVHTLYQFAWPVDGYAKGFRVEVRDARGRLLPVSLLHHVTGVTLDRRQYIYSAAERLFGIGKETEDVMLPGKLAVPLQKGQRLGYYVAWNNDTGKELKGLTVRVIMTWAPPAVTRELIAVLPLWLDVNNEVGGTNTFDLPPGKSTRTFEFTAPASGRILGISGHLHDYGVAMQLVDAESGAVLVRLPATKDANGRIKSIARKFYVVNPIYLREGHRYRVVAEYDSPLKQPLPKGAMGNIVGVIAPDDLKRWPSLNPADPSVQRDLASLGLSSGVRPGTQ